MAPRNGKPRRLGLGLVEVLLAIAISAVLLVAICMALSTLINTTKTNQSYLRARHSANTSLNYILTHVRRARELKLASPGARPDEYLSLTTADASVYDSTTGAWIDRYTLFQYDPANHTLSIAHGNSPSLSAQPVLHHVSNLIFRSVSDDGKNNYVTVEIAIDMPQPFASDESAAGSESFTLSGTASLRSL